jgi:triacylglycerol lipase
MRKQFARIVLSLLAGGAGMRAQTSYTGTFQSHHVSVNGTPADYTTPNVTIPFTISNAGASIEANITLNFPAGTPPASTDPTSFDQFPALNFKPPLLATVGVSGTFTTADDKFSSQIVLLDDEPLQSQTCTIVDDTKPVSQGSSSFSSSTPCTVNWVSLATTTSQQFTFKTQGSVFLTRGDGTGASFGFNVITTYAVTTAAPPTSADSNQAAPGPSGITPRDTSDTVYVAQTPRTGCTFAKDGPLVFKVPITRYVGAIDGDGHLARPAQLKQSRVVSAFARLTLPVYDVDYSAAVTSTQQPERDIVRVNGKNIGPGEAPVFLKGTDGQWQINTFLVPIELLKFPEQSLLTGATAVSPDPAENEIEVDLDVANPNHDLWCAGFEWAQLSFNAMAPVVLIHGTNASHTSWEDPNEIPPYLDAAGIPYHYKTIDLGANDDSSFNARLLCWELDQVATAFGTESLHLVAHSKGATDSRRFFNQNYTGAGCRLDTEAPARKFKILSLTSLDTPSRGTILSDVAIAASETSAVPGYEKSNDKQVASVMRSSWWVTMAAPSDPARAQQTIDGMRQFNADNPLYSGIQYFSVAADADLNNDGICDCDEASPLLPTWACKLSGGLGLANPMYQVLGGVSNVTVIARPIVLSGGVFTYNYANVVRGDFQPNDLTSTVFSAHYDGFLHILTTKANHSSVKRQGTIIAVLGALNKAFPLSAIPE